MLCIKCGDNTCHAWGITFEGLRYRKCIKCGKTLYEHTIEDPEARLVEEPKKLYQLTCKAPDCGAAFLYPNKLAKYCYVCRPRIRTIQNQLCMKKHNRKLKQARAVKKKRAKRGERKSRRIALSCKAVPQES